MLSFSFILMFPFFIFMGFFLFFLSLFFLNLKICFFIQWDMFIYSSKIGFPIYLDYMSSLFMSLVLLISGSIIFYSEYYMETEIYKSRFFYMMLFFVLSMIFLILCPNFICMLLGWDGLGLVSYCLVIYYQNYKSFSAGMLTALTNRVGDVFILTSISLFFSMGSWNYMNFFYMNDLFFIFMFFVIAAMTKSAQIPFSAWLPAAMAAPTPVSSLVHSSTLVTAGIYILIRFSYFIELYQLKFFLLVFSLMTMIMSGISGVYEFDMKKIIALSTLSQLGFMMSTLCMGLKDLTFFHLVTHACFKALLFMCAGFFIHSFFENQDIRCFGLMNKNFSLTLCMFNVANLSLCGFPFLSGFFSKDLILELILKSNMNILIMFLFLFGTFLTVFYSLRLMYFLTFKFSFFYVVIESNMKMLQIQNSMFLLFIFSICFGFVSTKLVFLPYNYIVLPFKMKILISLICLSSFFMVSLLLKLNLMFYLNKNLMMFFSSMWFLPFLKTDFLKYYFLLLSYKITKVSIGWVENMMGLKNISSMLFFSDSLNLIFKKMIYFIFFSFFIYLIFFLFICM